MAKKVKEEEVAEATPLDQIVPKIDDMRVEGPTPGFDVPLQPADELRPESMHEEAVKRVQAEDRAYKYARERAPEDTTNPTVYGDYEGKGDSPKPGDHVFYLVKDGINAGQRRPATVVRVKGDVCELFVHFSVEDGATVTNMQEVSRNDKGGAVPGTWDFKA